MTDVELTEVGMTEEEMTEEEMTVGGGSTGWVAGVQQGGLGCSVGVMGSPLLRSSQLLSACCSLWACRLPSCCLT